MRDDEDLSVALDRGGLGADSAVVDFFGRPRDVAAAELTDPGELLSQARALEPPLRLAERAQALDRLQQLLDVGGPPAALEGRDWQGECWAERAIDAARVNDLEQAQRLVDQVLGGSTSAVAQARAWEAQGRCLAWKGTDAATHRADRVLSEVAKRYRALGAREWAGHSTFWRANSVFFQNGDLTRAAALMREALRLLGRGSPWFATVLSFYADVLISQGDWTAAEAALTTGAELADRDDDAKSRAYVSWSRARMASTRGDAMATERHIRETERERGDWFDMNTGITFLADAAELLDRVGLPDQAADYLARATDRDPRDEFVRQARAALMARSGNPIQALEALQDLTRGDWLEKRLLWRHTLLTGWATFRAGRDDAGPLTVRALELAEASGGLATALAGEQDLVTALLPLAEAAGSVDARRLLLDGRPLLIRLLGTERVTRADGSEVGLPPGKPGELVRLLAVHPQGASVEQIGEWFFPDASAASARHRLRQVLTRLRSNVGDIVTREEDRLLLVPAWVDVREFLAAADRVRSATRARAAQRAYAALALWGGGPLAAVPNASWADDIRDQVDHQYLSLLDLITADAARHGSHHEAVTALSAAMMQAPYDQGRYYELAEHLLALGRHATASHLARLAGIDLDHHEA